MKLMILLLLPLFVIAKEPKAKQKDEKIIKVHEDASYEFSTCAAYYSVVSIAMRDSNKPDMEKAYDQLGNNAYLFSFELAKYIRKEKMASKVVLSRIELSFKSMMKEIDSSSKNISILMSKHLEPCDSLMKNPTDHLERKLNKL